MLFGVEDVGELDQVAAAGAEGAGDHLEGAVVLLLGLEVADGAVVEVEDDVELGVEVELAEVAFDEGDLEVGSAAASRLAISIRSGAMSDADDGEAAAGELDASGDRSRRRGRGCARRPRGAASQGAVDFGLGALGPGHVGLVPGEGRRVPVLRYLIRKHAHLPLPRRGSPIGQRSLKDQAAF